MLGGVAASRDKTFMTSPDRRMAVLILVLGLLALGAAFGAQDFLGMAPCELCLWERWPYRILIGLGLVAVFAPIPLRRALLWVAGVDGGRAPCRNAMPPTSSRGASAA
jgi:disulfide bond formation protein DsbB